MSSLGRISPGLEELLARQAGARTLEVLEPEEEERVTVLAGAYRDQAAAVLSLVYDSSMSVPEEVPVSQVLSTYLNNVQAQFGCGACQSVAVFHGLSGSTLDPAQPLSRLDFPGIFALFGPQGFVDRTFGPEHCLVSPPSLSGDASQRSASPPAESVAQLDPRSLL